MKPMNTFGLTALVLSTAVLTACGGSSGGGSNDDDNNNGGQAAVDCELGQVSPNQLDGKDVCVLSGVINQDLTLSTNFIYELDGAVAVGTGNREITSEADIQEVKDNGVTLTIDPGVEFRSSEADTLIITRGSKIMAEGTAAEPITMSSKDGDFDGQGEWGGLIVMGFAENNLCPNNSQDAVCNLEAEGGAQNHGGNDNADNSGVIKYLRIAEGGFEVSTDNEVNGLTLFSVGYNTVLENIQIHGNQDDGIEFFGGAVNVKNLVLTENFDDSIDWDEGYRGNIQYVVVRRVDGAGEAIEADNAGPSNDAMPISKPSLANFTFVNEAAAGSASYMARLRRGTGAFMTNGAFVDGGDTCLRLDDLETANQAGGELEDTNVLMDCTNQIGNGNGNTKTAGDFDFTDVALSIDAAYALNEAEATVTSVTAPSANDTTGFFDATDYVGAVEPGTAAGDAWWAGWIIPGSLPDPVQ
ncbi:MAG: hypothetical protein ACQES2_03945 [Pseudomonadota bacterium]